MRIWSRCAIAAAIALFAVPALALAATAPPALSRFTGPPGVTVELGPQETEPPGVPRASDCQEPAAFIRPRGEDESAREALNGHFGAEARGWLTFTFVVPPRDPGEHDIEILCSGTLQSATYAADGRGFIIQPALPSADTEAIGPRPSGQELLVLLVAAAVFGAALSIGRIDGSVT